jgi:hypothetical protein
VGVSQWAFRLEASGCRLKLTAAVSVFPDKLACLLARDAVVSHDPVDLVLVAGRNRARRFR